MKSIKTYNTQVEAELARIALDAEDISAVVVGVGVGMEGGMGGVQLLVADEHVERALWRYSRRADAHGARSPRASADQKLLSLLLYVEESVINGLCLFRRPNP